MKAKFGVAGRRLLLTFGLLSRNKGIETVIRALPAVVRVFPDAIYFVVGATHPVVVRHEGEAYRTLLEREAERLGVREHVVFRGQFVANDELRQYLQATDVFVSPYLNEAQVTSGALSYAMGAGAAVVSTPYWHAQELLAAGRGRLFPFNDHEALSNTLLELFSSPADLQRVRGAAFTFARSMAWPRVGDAYFETMSTIVRAAALEPTALPAAQPLAVSSLPELCLDHLLRMTDDTGIIQHAAYSVPARSTGYCVDDNARALIVAVRADRIHGGADTRVLVTRYLSYLHGSQQPDGSFRNFMSYERVLDSALASDDCTGRAIWALGITASIAADHGCRLLAREMLTRALPHRASSDLAAPHKSCSASSGCSQSSPAPPKSVACSMIWSRSCSTLIARMPRTTGAGSSRRLPTTTRSCRTRCWRRIRLPVSGSRCMTPASRSSFSRRSVSKGTSCELVGNTGWHSSGGEKASADEQAIDATALVLAFSCAYAVTKDRHYLRRMREAFAWFLGANRLGVPLYDFATGGCHDGIGMSHVNKNQGAESTICFLLALLEMLKVDGGGPSTKQSPGFPLAQMRPIGIKRTQHRLSPDARRVLAKPYLPGRRSDLAGRVARASPVGAGLRNSRKRS